MSAWTPRSSEWSEKDLILREDGSKHVPEKDEIDTKTTKYPKQVEHTCGGTCGWRFSCFKTEKELNENVIAICGRLQETMSLSSRSGGTIKPNRPKQNETTVIVEKRIIEVVEVATYSPELETLCAICMDEKADFLVVPCGHKCGCKKCLEQLIQCPICRTKIESILKVVNCGVG